MKEWKPNQPSLVSFSHRNTVAMREKRPLCRDIFEVVECFESGAGNSDKFNRVTTITIMLHHLEQCPLSNVSNSEDRTRMRVRVDDAIKKNSLR